LKHSSLELACPEARQQRGEERRGVRIEKRAKKKKEEFKTTLEWECSKRANERRGRLRLKTRGKQRTGGKKKGDLRKR